jgi:hypothetical protein
MPEAQCIFCSVDIIVALDACFKQKHRKGQTDQQEPARHHPETVFLAPDQVSSMEELVDELRPPRKRGRDIDPHVAEVPDGYEGTMKVPISVLNECRDSFLAADEKREKASTQFFSDTGVMALLCRHDRVLWLVNMTTAGEKQYYALALLQRLFESLPHAMRVGLLYDIGCQLHRSCVKWGFLQQFLDRVVFGISVFHAYGHQWPCQIMYHPRKCAGFGLTDGEGCERFWSSIKQLIPSMRVSGYYQRLYTIDSQIKHLDMRSLHSLGLWLSRKWLACHRRKQDAIAFLTDLYRSHLTEDTLRKEWAAQVKEQTKPLVRQSRGLANKIILEILTLKSSCEFYQAEMNRYEALLESGDYADGMDVTDVTLHLEDFQQKHAQAEKAIRYKRASLDVDGRLSLHKLLNNKFLQTRMNALALKKRIRNRLQQRKFELEALERAYRHTTNSK